MNFKSKSIAGIFLSLVLSLFSLFSLLMTNNGWAMKEIELENPLIDGKISSVDTEYDLGVARKGLLPAGSALITSSGNLAETRITAIIHAASGSMNLVGPGYTPTLKSVAASVKNSIILAKRNGYDRVAVPFIGGAIFISRIGVSPRVLASTIIQSALDHRNGIEVRLITYSDEDTALFREVLGEFLNLPEYESIARDRTVGCIQGSMTNYEAHGARAIVNAANMEVVFGGGLSGMIGKATGKSKEINAEASELIQLFNNDLSARLRK